MEVYDKESIIKQYEESGEKIYHATLEGDYRTNNREAKKLINLFKLFEKDDALFEDCIDALLNSSNIVVKSKGAAYCLALGKHVDRAERLLTEISKEDSIFGFNAEMTLKGWKEEGYLLVYLK